MQQTDFTAKIERYAAELRRMAARSRFPQTAPAPAPTREPVWPEEEAGAETGTETPPDLCAETPDPPERYETFVAENASSGSLRVQATAGREALPVARAEVTVRKVFADGAHLFARAETDESGVAADISLPAPARLAETPPGEAAPCAVYELRVTHPDFRAAQTRHVTIFAGVQSVQPVHFLPFGERD